MLRARGLTLRVGERELVSGLDLDCGAGTWTAICGPSGVGKTTVLRALAGLRSPDGGSVSHPDRDGIGLLSQDLGLLPELSAERNVALAQVLAGAEIRRALQEARDLLGRLGVPEGKARGEQQRVALARALAGRRPLLLLDEPTTALDEDTTRVILDLLAARRDEGACLVTTTHDPLVMERAERCIAL